MSVTARARWIVHAAAWVAAALLLVLAVRDVQEALHQGTAADLVVDHLAARAFLDGYTPFSPEGARRSGVAVFGATGIGHPPTTSFWVLPLAGLSLQAAREVVGWLSLMTLVGGLVFASLRLQWPAVVGALLAAVVATSPFFLYLVSLGQVSQLIAFSYLVAWWSARQGRQALAGGALGIACTLKLFPGVMLIWLAVTRRWRAVAVAVAVYLIAAVVMTARFGLDSWRVFFVAQKEVANAWLANVANLSVHGVIQRLWANPACQLPGPVAGEALALSTLLAAVLLVLAARQARRAPADDLGFGVFAVLSVVTSQWAWPHYHVLLALPVLIAATKLRPDWTADRVRVWAGAAVVVALLVSWRLEVRAATVLQVALWRGEPVHLRLHLAEILGWLPVFLLLALLARLAGRPLPRSA